MSGTVAAQSTIAALDAETQRSQAYTARPGEPRGAAGAIAHCTLTRHTDHAHPVHRVLRHGMGSGYFEIPRMYSTAEGPHGIVGRVIGPSRRATIHPGRRVASAGEPVEGLGPGILDNLTARAVDERDQTASLTTDRPAGLCWHRRRRCS